MEAAHRDILNFGIEIDMDVGNILNLNINREEVVDSQTTVENIIPEVSDHEHFSTFLKHDEDLENNTDKEGGLDLKDYTGRNVDLSGNSPFLKVSLPNKKDIIVKKSLFCWLLEEEKGRISTDRLKRFQINKRKTAREPSNLRVKKSIPNQMIDSSSGDSEAENIIPMNLDEDSDQVSELNSDSESSLLDNLSSSESSGPKIEIKKYYAFYANSKWFLGQIISK